jgi:hypothetical protein
MRLIDLRNDAVPTPGDDGTPGEDRSYLVLAADTTYRFRHGQGNRIPWRDLEPLLESRLPGGFHEALGDVSLGLGDVSVDARCGDEGIAWICRQLVARQIVSPSVPVSVQHLDGHEEQIGAVGRAAAGAERTEILTAYA